MSSKHEENCFVGGQVRGGYTKQYLSRTADSFDFFEGIGYATINRKGMPQIATGNEIKAEQNVAELELRPSRWAKILCVKSGTYTNKHHHI